MGKRDEILIAILEGRRHSMANRLLAPLCQSALVRIVAENRFGTATKVELTETGVVVAKQLKREQAKE